MITRKQGAKELVFQSGDTLTFQSGSAATAPGGANMLEHAIHLDIADASADTTYYLVAPFAGTISKIWTITDGAVGTADITVTASINGVAVTNGVVTIATAASAAGDVDSATPTAANTVAAGDKISLAVAGGGSGGSPRIHAAIVIAR